MMPVNTVGLYLYVLVSYGTGLHTLHSHDVSYCYMTYINIHLSLPPHSVALGRERLPDESAAATAKAVAVGTYADGGGRLGIIPANTDQYCDRSQHGDYDACDYSPLFKVGAARAFRFGRRRRRVYRELTRARCADNLVRCISIGKAIIGHLPLCKFDSSQPLVRLVTVIVRIKVHSPCVGAGRSAKYHRTYAAFDRGVTPLMTSLR